MERERNKQAYRIAFFAVNIVLLLLASYITFGIDGTHIVSDIKEFIVDQTEPFTVVAANITPYAAYTNSTLNCTIVVRDITTNITGNISWWVNETEMLTETGASMFDSLVHENFTGLTPEYFIKGDNISCNITLMDQGGNLNTSTATTTILNHPPWILNLSYPEYNDELFTNRTPKFNWTNATDIDNETVWYLLQIDTNNDFTDGLFLNQTNITTNFYVYNTTELDIDITYYWRVAAYDIENISDWSDVWNFTVKSRVGLNIINYTIDFGLMTLGQTNDTANSDPYPFKVENTGNVDANVNISSLGLWSSNSAPLNTSYFMYKANKSSEANSFEWANSQTTWNDMSDTPTLLLHGFNHSNEKDLATVDILVEVPMDEQPGLKNTNVTLRAEENTG